MKKDIPQETLRWILGGIAQSLTALVAFIGILIIFKFERMIERSSENKKQKWGDIKIQGKELTDFFKKFSVYVFFIILCCLIFLIITPFISEHHRSIPWLFITISFTGYAFFLVVKKLDTFFEDCFQPNENIENEQHK
ncbi:MAG: hypothetical protein AAB514_00295 [Patescibacteria group bacterium]